MRHDKGTGGGTGMYGDPHAQVSWRWQTSTYVPGRMTAPCPSSPLFLGERHQAKLQGVRWQFLPLPVAAMADRARLPSRPADGSLLIVRRLWLRLRLTSK
jgi:hypothetical protein